LVTPNHLIRPRSSALCRFAARQIVVSLAVAIIVLIACVPSAAIAADRPVARESAARPFAVDRKVNDLENEIGNLSVRLESAEDSFERIFIPVTILITLLSAGGFLGIVYSFRDQRRVSQIHELTVGGEIAAQRRSEHSYGSFFEQSQTTLSLVNETLGLAKEANDRAIKGTKSKAQVRIDELEKRSVALLIDVFTEEEFELIINDSHRREELHDIAGRLRSLEEYLNLQEIELPRLTQYTKFVKALDQFLLDDTEAGIQALRLASQEGSMGVLQRFTRYWLGYMLTTIGEYREALTNFHHEDLALGEDHAEYFQVQRILAETRFFREARRNIEAENADSKEKVVSQPPARFEKVAELLDELAGLAERLEQSSDEHAKADTRLEIARTRADIYEWVAYDADHLDDPLGNDEFRAVEEICGEVLKEEVTIVSAKEFISTSSTWDRLQSPNVFRAWVLGQARAICLQSGDSGSRNLDVDFALAECQFKLGEPADAAITFENAEQALHDEAKKLHEKRRGVSIRQSELICHCRLLKIKEKDPAKKGELTRRARESSSETIALLKDMSRGRVTIFSQIQRRNITKEEFEDEVLAIGKQAGIWEKQV
jgi:tetratricopeptide (TPR) repeat protein